MRKNILVISSSRADRGLLEPVANKLGDECEFHIMEQPATYACCSGIFNEGGEGKKVVLLGDRWETCLLAFHAVEVSALIYHLHGGEETLGSVDNIWRRAVTSMAQCHLTAHQDFADRVIRMGENPENVFTVGSLGVWRAKQLPPVPKENKLTVILHPNTIEPEKTESEVSTLLNALKSFSGDFRIKFYAPNHDSGRGIIDRKIRAFCELYGCEYIEDEQGDDFLNSLKSSKCIIGNSSCGIIEAPSLKTPTVNIGNRQDGRPTAKSILNVNFNEDNIFGAIKTTLNCRFNYTNPYDNVEHDTVDMICHIIRKHPVKFQKRFMD